MPKLTVLFKHGFAAGLYKRSLPAVSTIKVWIFPYGPLALLP
jgi:hypothetical protein